MSGAREAGEDGDHVFKGLKAVAARCQREIGFYRAVLSDPRTPRGARWLLGLALAYAVSPVDLIPDFIPVLGHLDDVLLVPLLIWLALRLIPKDVLAEHRSRCEQTSCWPSDGRR